MQLEVKGSPVEGAAQAQVYRHEHSVLFSSAVAT